jgi:hypothetical protein
MAEPTNGPWEILRLSGKLDDWTGSSIVIRAKGAPGGLCVIMGGLGPDEELANAHLIAASLEMLRVLKFMVDQMEEPANAHHTLGDYIHGSGIADAKAAIAKAEVR